MSLLRTLDRRLAAVLGLLLTLVGVVGVVSTLLTTRHHLVEAEQKLNWTLAAQLVQESALLEHGVIEEANLDRVLHMLKVINPNNEIYILDAEGSILHTSSMTPPVRDAVDLEPVRRFLATRGRPLVLGDDPLMAEGRRTFSAARIPGDGERSQGYLYVVLAGSGERSLTEALRGSSILRLGASVVLSFLALSLVAGWVLLRLLTRRLRRLDRAMREFSNSGFAQVPAREERDVGGQRDDLERLDRTFHRMAERIVEQMEETQRADRLRRELVANVSHDLRTPLASLQGYLETLRLKDDSLSADDRRRYLDIALSQSQRLAHLVSELFDLAKLDAGEVAIELEPAPVGELAQDLVQQFQPEARRHGLELRIELPPRLPLVLADLRLIERALENLVVNALEHTPPGGSVTVRFTELEGEVETRVEDTGCGIPEDELARIFERFYTGGRRPSDRPPGTGLGLAITRRLLELHGSDISVVSEVGVGSAFSFRLATARGTAVLPSP